MLYFGISRTTRQKLFLKGSFHEFLELGKKNFFRQLFGIYRPKYWPKYIGYNVEFVVIMADVYALVV